MKRILLALLVTTLTLSVSAQIKKADDGYYYIYSSFSYPSINIRNMKDSYAPLLKVTAFGKFELVTENGKAVLFNSGTAVKNYLSLKGWECLNQGTLLSPYRKKVTKEELAREVESCKIFLETEEAIKAYTETVNSNPTLAGHRMFHVVGQTEL
ncbi:hypothetical protein [Prevotella falsenii]|uniref:hypothetical protein n=1 Tax=Prevotella falsenii TaxID=515414 RepID=UPI00046AD122|nr:hypothetical protein [Prevotella falsenii]